VTAAAVTRAARPEGRPFFEEDDDEGGMMAGGSAAVEE
jgi:hypothetical protein